MAVSEITRWCRVKTESGEGLSLLGIQGNYKGSSASQKKDCNYSTVLRGNRQRSQGGEKKTIYLKDRSMPRKGSKTFCSKKKKKLRRNPKNLGRDFNFLKVLYANCRS